MPRYTAAQIYAFARDAGFSPDQATTMTAIALAESTGDSRAHNTNRENSQGLWQINVDAHPTFDERFDLFDPAQNARAAYLVAEGGADVSAWTTTHRLLAARYLRYQEEAQAAAVAYGDPPGLGVWTGTVGYEHPLPAGAPGASQGSGSEAVVVSSAQAAGADQPPAGPYGLAVDHPHATYGLAVDSAPSPPSDEGNLAVFLNAATRQAGDQYVFGSETALGDPDPTRFDCSELVQWAGHQAGVRIEDGAIHQYRQMARSGTVVPVEEAINTPGALLFSFSSDPDETIPDKAHVAISLGNGQTIEARNPRAGVGIFTADTRRFQYAAVIPGISDRPAAAPVVEESVVTQPPEDTFEQRLALDPSDLDAASDPLLSEPAVQDPVAEADDGPPGDLDQDGFDDALTAASYWAGAADDGWTSDEHQP